MSIMSKLALSGGATEEANDSLGGFSNLPSGLYPVKLGLCYMTQSPKGTIGMVVSYKVNNAEYNKTFWVTNKNGDTTYERDGVSYPIRGWSQANAICRLANGKPLNEQVTEERSVKVWDNGKQVPKPKECLVTLIGTELVFGILEVAANKQKLQGDKYVPTAERQEFNEISLIANTKGLTLAEFQKGQETPEFVRKWEDKYAGKFQDRYKEIGGSAAVKSAARSSAALSFDD